MAAQSNSEPPGESRVEGGVRGLLRVLLIVALLAAFAFMVVRSLHWPLLADAQVMRYANFLIDHGFAPYRDILDINMPGTYFSDRAAVFLFGTSDLGWRMYDIFLMVSATVGMIAIAWPTDWLAGLFGGVLFALLHAADGPTGTGERDLFITVLMIVGYAFLFYSVRRGRPGWMVFLGFCMGMAATVKPTTASLGFLLLAMAGVVLHKRRMRAMPTMLYGLSSDSCCATTRWRLSSRSPEALPPTMPDWTGLVG